MTEESVMSSIRKRPFDGYRGYDPEGGWWISLEESKVLAMNEEWWTETETSIGAKPVAIPKNNKLWMFESGTMHLGPWRNIIFGRGGKNRLCEVDYGIKFHRGGRCYVGKFCNGAAQGLGRLFWLKNSPTWQSNCHPGSSIRDPIDREGEEPEGLPYEFVGRFQNDRKHDGYGIATLKDGTKKIGGWIDDVIVGREWFESHESCLAVRSEHGVDWWTHHETLLAPLDISSPATRKLEHKKAPPTSRKRAATNFYRPHGKSRRTPREFVAESAARPCSVSPDSSTAIDKDHADYIPRILSPATRKQKYKKHWKFRRILEHQGPITRNHPLYKGSFYNLKVEWENEEITYEPLTKMIEDDKVSVAQYGLNNNLLDRTGWKGLKSIAKRETMGMQHQEHPQNNTLEVATTPENNVHATNCSNKASHSSSPGPIPENTTSKVRTAPDTNRENKRNATNSDHNNVNAVSTQRDDNDDVATVLGRDAIGYNANHDEMKAYANELDVLGLHSIPMILRFCQGDDVNEWPWMKPFHKRAFRAWLESKP